MGKCKVNETRFTIRPPSETRLNPIAIEKINSTRRSLIITRKKEHISRISIQWSACVTTITRSLETRIQHCKKQQELRHVLERHSITTENEFVI